MQLMPRELSNAICAHGGRSMQEKTALGGDQKGLRPDTLIPSAQHSRKPGQVHSFGAAGLVRKIRMRLGAGNLPTDASGR